MSLLRAVVGLYRRDVVHPSLMAVPAELVSGRGVALVELGSEERPGAVVLPSLADLLL